MNRTRSAIVVISLFAVVVRAELAIASGDSVGLEDLPNYHAALSPGVGRSPAVDVTFRELWDHPAGYRDRLVSLNGRVARRFRQPPIGRFPALTETWLVDAAGNPTCFVSPASGAAGGEVEIGAWVRVSGTFMKQLRFQGADVSRLAPLIVGPRGPSLMKAATRSEPLAPGHGAFDWVVGLGAGAVVAAVLAGLHLKRPGSRTSPLGPAPTFFSNPDDAHDDSSVSGNMNFSPGGEHADAT